ncbi:helix-turn-helix domain-containing protein [Tunicatimonas pelagia]|uniref:helix-turn-helix domain-containing protein n=1 Tax=Tunicatimonas pelagia TaxID=931531 RepID=UPI00266584FC|nr:helix-turn-helix transcriptional regulator [Tunicatimonas pelagia]WKN45813.1 helix-turn-helix transcriptional regulator [Tunicatimonas pelagia]
MITRQDALNKLNGIILDGRQSATPSQWHEDVKRRAEEKPWKKRSQAVALAVLRTLRAKKMSQKELAEQLGVSAQLVNKWVKGKENFTFETVSKLEEALDIQLMQVTGLKKQTTKLKEYIMVEKVEKAKKSHKPTQTASTETKVIPMSRELSYIPDEQYAYS